MSYDITHRTFAYLFGCATRHLAIAKYSQARGAPFEHTGRPKLENPDDVIATGDWVLTGGTFYDCMSCLTFCALTIEAAVNHVAAEKISNWNEIERKYSPEKKLAALTTATGCQFDFSSDPFKHFDWLKEFRDTLAHGKTKTVSMPDASSIEEADAKWMSQCTVEEAEKGLVATRAMVEYMFSRILSEKMPFGLLSHGGGTGRWPTSGFP